MGEEPGHGACDRDEEGVVDGRGVPAGGSSDRVEVDLDPGKGAPGPGRGVQRAARREPAAAEFDAGVPHRGECRRGCSPGGALPRSGVAGTLGCGGSGAFRLGQRLTGRRWGGFGGAVDDLGEQRESADTVGDHVMHHDDDPDPIVGGAGHDHGPPQRAVAGERCRDDVGSGREYRVERGRLPGGDADVPGDVELPVVNPARASTPPSGHQALAQPRHPSQSPRDLGGHQFRAAGYRGEVQHDGDVHRHRTDVRRQLDQIGRRDRLHPARPCHPTSIDDDPRNRR